MLSSVQQENNMEVVNEMGEDPFGVQNQDLQTKD